MAIERDLHQYLLPSGVGIGVVELFPSEKDKLTKDLAHTIGKDASVLDFRVSEMREGVLSMLKFYTKAKFKKPEDLLSLTEKDWVEVDKLSLEDSYDKVFTAKDDAVLCAIYKRLHEVSLDEIESIVGKARTVSTG